LMVCLQKLPQFEKLYPGGNYKSMRKNSKRNHGSKLAVEEAPCIDSFSNSKIIHILSKQ
jgi:hypothetical protein